MSAVVDASVLVAAATDAGADGLWAEASYHPWYVAVAEAFDLPLASLDRCLVRAAGPTCAVRCV